MLRRLLVYPSPPRPKPPGLPESHYNACPHSLGQLPRLASPSRPCVCRTNTNAGYRGKPGAPPTARNPNPLAIAVPPTSRALAVESTPHRPWRRPVSSSLDSAAIVLRRYPYAASINNDGASGDEPPARPELSESCTGCASRGGARGGQRAIP